MFIYLTLTSVYMAVDFKLYAMIFDVLDMAVINEIPLKTKKQWKIAIGLLIVMQDQWIWKISLFSVNWKVYSYQRINMNFDL